jgi:hypothetical protein
VSHLHLGEQTGEVRVALALVRVLLLTSSSITIIIITKPLLRLRLLIVITCNLLTMPVCPAASIMCSAPFCTIERRLERIVIPCISMNAYP